MAGKRHQRKRSIMAFGVGAFTQALLRILKEDGAQVAAYLTRNYAHYPPSCEGTVYSAELFPDPCPILRERKIDFVVPMSIDWAQSSWAKPFLRSRVPILSPTGDGMNLERDREFARRLCHHYRIACPKAYVARNRLEAEQILVRHKRPYVIKNPFCAPASPIHTIACESAEDTQSWLEHLDYSEGVFLQEYLGRAEAGHVALVSDGQIHSLVTNQEYKRAFNGNMGIVAGGPMGGIVEADPEDKYHLARELLHPLRPWFKKVGFHGPVQVTAIKHNGKWHVLEYNVRLGITCGAMILRILANPLETLWKVARNQKVTPRFHSDRRFGCSVTLAGYGYPYIALQGPPLPVDITGAFDCDVWWNEVTAGDGRLRMTGHRIADVVALDVSLDRAITTAYRNIGKIRCLGSYYRTDIGASLWPPGLE